MMTIDSTGSSGLAAATRALTAPTWVWGRESGKAASCVFVAAPPHNLPSPLPPLPHWGHATPVVADNGSGRGLPGVRAAHSCFPIRARGALSSPPTLSLSLSSLTVASSGASTSNEAPVTGLQVTFMVQRQREWGGEGKKSASVGTHHFSRK